MNTPDLSWIFDLEPACKAGELSTVSSGWRVKKASAALGSGPVTWAVELGRSMAATIASEVPGHRSDNGSDILRMGNESVILQALLEFSGVPSGTLVTDDALGGVQDFVQRQLTMEDMLRGIRFGHSLLTEALLDECIRRSDPDLARQQMRFISGRMFELFDDFALRMEQEYHQQEAQWAQSQTARQIRTIESIVQGHSIDELAAARILRYDLKRTHVGLVAWSTERNMDAEDGSAVKALRRALSDVGVGQSLVIPAHLGVAWAWTSGGCTTTELAGRLRALRLPSDLRICIGSAGMGIQGFRTSHDDAEAAFALASTTSTPGHVIEHSDVDTAGLLLENRVRARRFAVSELGRLSTEQATVADLRKTLAVYLETGGSPQTASERLSVSRNTVTYRVHKAEELLGRDVSVRRFQLQAALEILARLSS
ncbi:PucR family transcriptional regulator [Rothia uropygioeca]|uniref:PucR family transcriptional regulator n=1 Tax=Kocuria sp. 257 TaxID=2021970 RepID=UPI001010A26C|nr:PucR family transcriptional regulator [Kocuria sp. 257]